MCMEVYCFMPPQPKEFLTFLKNAQYLDNRHKTPPTELVMPRLHCLLLTLYHSKMWGVHWLLPIHALVSKGSKKCPNLNNC